jgi:hypothetical protein
MFKATFTYKKTTNIDWFEVHYASDTAIMELYNYHLNYFNSLPGCSLTLSENEDGTVGTGIYTYPTEDLAPEITSDPKIQEFFTKVYEYYNTHNVDIDMIKEEI